MRDSALDALRALGRRSAPARSALDTAHAPGPKSARAHGAPDTAHAPGPRSTRSHGAPDTPPPAGTRLDVLDTPRPRAARTPSAAAGHPAPTRRSALYVGSVRHRRHGRLSDEFRFPLFMAYVVLDELPQLFDGRWLWSARRPAPAWFRRADYLGDPSMPLEEAVRALVAERTGRRPAGPIALLTHLRYFGVGFNPVSFYYCFDATGERVAAVVAHVTNTPWGERHAYVLDVERAAADHGGARVISGRSDKQLHVSPLMGMDNTYEWRLTEPGERLAVHIASVPSHGGAAAIFDATLSLRRREMGRREMTLALVRYPLLTARVLARIYGHALRLRLRGATYHPHPNRGAVSA